MPEEQPLYSLHIYRRVLNVPPGMLDVMLDTAKDEGAPVPTINDDELWVNIIGPGELRAVVQGQGLELTEEETDDLGDHILDELPAISHEPITIATFPTSVFTDPRQPRKKFVTIGTANPTANFERALCGTLIRSHLELPGIDVAHGPNRTSPRLGKFTGDPNEEKAGKFQSFLHRHPHLLPALLELSPIHVDSID
jgi:hypothetical protein